MNHLDNAYWTDKDRVINQRTKQIYSIDSAIAATVDNIYAIDRWRMAKGISLEILDSAIKLIDNGTNGFNFICQLIETPPIGLTVTISALVRGTGPAYTGVPNKSETAKFHNLTADNFTLIANTFVYPEPTGHFWHKSMGIGFSPDAQEGDWIEIKAAKFELGPVQTLAHKEGDTWVLNDPPPNKAQELAKCQRYQLNLIAKGSTRYSPIDTGLGTVDAKGFAGFEIGIPTTLRAAPTVSFTGKFNLTFTDGTKAPVSSITSNYYNSHVIGLKVFSDSTLTPGTLCGLWTDLPDDGMVNSIMLDANL